MRKQKTTLDTGVKTTIKNNRITVKSQILKEEPIYNQVTLDTALKNELKNSLIKLQN